MIPENAKEYCCEDISKIENYEEALAAEEIWHCHHRLEIQGQFYNSVELLKRCGMYYKVPASQLILLSPSDHMKLHHGGIHNPNIGRHFSEESRRKMSEAAKGRGLGRHLSEETKKKLSRCHLGRKMSAETRLKISVAQRGRVVSQKARENMSKSRIGKVSNAKGKKWSISSRTRLSRSLTGRHLSEQTRNNISLAKKGIPNLNLKGRRWFNNGVKSVMAYECPDGFVEGRLYRRKR